MPRSRKKTWDEKVELVMESFHRAKKNPVFARQFYEYFFFLEPKVRTYFQKTDLLKQEKLLLNGLEFMFGFLTNNDENDRVQFLRICKTHAKGNLNIHPHHYYYWIEALIMTGKKCDPDWFDDLEFYWREVASFPVMFMASQYFGDSKAA